ncbi:MAG: translocation/assembly module TamB domain-containing protein, partial [Ferruginibacter sp.]
QGTLSGSTQNIIANVKLGSSYGPIAVKGFINNLQNPKTSTYDLFITTPGFNIGKLIKQDSVLGTVAGTFIAKGSGFDYKTMRSSIKADVASLQYNKYKYRNAVLKSNFNNGLIESTGSINDSSLRLKYVLNADVRNQYPLINATLNVDTVQLQKLNLYKDTLNFAGNVIVKSNSLRPRSLDASLFLDSTRLQLGKNSFYLDTVSLVATSANGIDSINLKAPFAEIHAGGAFDYDKVGASLQQYISKYYRFPDMQPAAGTVSDQQIGFFGVIKKSPVITGIIPGLSYYDDINFSGNYTSADTDSALNFKADIPKLNYQTNSISKGAINIQSRNERINYEMKFDTLRTASNVLYATNISGAAAHDSIALNAITKDNKKRDWFGIRGDAFIKDGVYSFRLKDNLLLNYEKWNVAPDNYISYSKQGIIINNFLINSDTARINIKSQALVPNSPIDIDVKNFNLKSISSLTSGDTLFAAGLLNINAKVSDLDKKLPAFTGNASINNLEILQHLVGNITAFAEKQSENNIVANLNLAGNENDISIKGNYYLNNTEKEFDADVNIKKLSLKTLEAFAAGSLKNSTGDLHGNLMLQGKFAEPHWKGELDFDTTRFTLTQLGTPYKIDNQKIVLDYPRITFPQFIISDSLDNKMKIDGYISSNSLSDFSLNLDINATDFILVNAPKAIDNQFYGYASVDANISITGNSSAPDIQGDVYVNDVSDLTIVLPENNYGKDEGKTIVRFIDRDTFDINPPVIAFEQEKITTPGFGAFINYNLNLEINKNATLTVIVDPVTGDEIKVQGDAQLNVGVDPGGNIVLAGTYELDNGYYDLNYQFLERKFKLIKGSTITFGGAPQNAQVNITAEYVVNTSAKDLLSNEVGDVSPTLRNSFNQKLPFKVVLYLNGVLSQPTINFDIQLPEQSNLLTSGLKSTIDNKLAQLRADPAATNKQVFSLLLLNRFVGEQSSDFFKGNGGDFSDLARQSVSQFLSSALNEIAGDLFKGVDVDLNLNSYNDFTQGGNQQRTDLNIAVSKTFLDDRVTVSVGQNFGLQGQDAAAKASGANTGFKPDVSIGYKLTKDGKYLLRAYTKNQFEVVLDGYVVETGLAFLVTLEYEKFNELFRRKKKAAK